MFNKSLITNIIAALVAIMGYFIPKYGHILTTAGYFALSGAITNWLAVYMLFERVPFLYGSGIIPLHFKEFKLGIKQLIMDQFFTEKSLKDFFKKHQMSQEFTLPIEHLIQGIDFDFIFHNISQTILSSKFGTALALFGGEKALLPLKEPMIQKLHDLIHQILSSDKFKQAFLHESLSKEVHQKIEHIVDERLAMLTPAMVKTLIQNMIHKHLGWLVIWGGIFGGLIGMILELVKIVQF